MKNIISSFTQEELQLLYAACMSYGDKLSEIIKSIPNGETDKLSDRAKDSWNLARKITGYMEDWVMRSPLSSNLSILIEKAIDNCFETGDGKSSNKDGIEVTAEWVDSKRKGYSVIHLTIPENGVVKFSYDDYGTEFAN